MLEDLIHIPVLGVIPYFNHNLEDEDSATDFSSYQNNLKGDFDIAVIKLPKMSNFTDFNVFKLFKDVRFRFVGLNENLGTPDLIIVPGTKSTIDDLNLLKESQMDEQILKAHQLGSYVFGICGGYQMIGEKIKDLNKVESTLEEIDGLSLLSVETNFEKVKTTTLTEGVDNIFRCKVKGYEIHMGNTRLHEGVSSFIKISKRDGLNHNEVNDGAVNKSETVFGTYLHGIFDNTDFTRRLINKIRVARGKGEIDEEIPDYFITKEEQYDTLANIVRKHLDMKAIYRILEEGIGD